MSELSKLIQGCKRGEQESFSRLIDLYSKRLYGFFFRLSNSREESEDLLNELFIKIIEKISSLRDENAFESWLFRLAANLHRDRLRSKIRQRELLKAAAEEKPTSTRPRDTLADTDLLQSAMRQLDEDTQAVIAMRFGAEMSFKEIAAARDEPIATTLSKVHRGLRKLRKMMETENG